MRCAPAPCVVAAALVASASTASAQLARFVPEDCNLTGILEGMAFDPISMEEFNVVGTSEVAFTPTTGGGGTSGGLVGIMVANVDMFAEIFDGRGVEPARIVVTSEAVASFNPAYVGSISGAFTLRLTFNIASTTEFEVVQVGDPGTIFLSALTGEISGNLLLPGSYEIFHSDGAFASPTIPSHSTSGTWTLYLPAPSAAAPLAMMAILARRRVRPKLA